MKKITILSISLLALLTSCSVESDSVQGVSNKEQSVTANSIAGLATASISLTQQYKAQNIKEVSVDGILKNVESLSFSGAFLKLHNLSQQNYVGSRGTIISRLLNDDWTIVQEGKFSDAFKAQVEKILDGSEDLNYYHESVDNNSKLSLGEKRIIFDAVDMSLISSEHGIDDEWRKRKFMGYILSQNLTELNVVTTTTVLNIAMEQ